MTEREASNQCETKYNTDAEVNACVEDLLSGVDKKESDTKQPMAMNTKIAIGVGVLVLGIGVVLVLKNRKK